VIEPQPAEQQHRAIGYTHGQHQGEHDGVVVVDQAVKTVADHFCQLAPVLLEQVLDFA